jgi:YD repeat-containing protein
MALASHSGDRDQMWLNVVMVARLAALLVLAAACTAADPEPSPPEPFDWSSYEPDELYSLVSRHQPRRAVFSNAADGRTTSEVVFTYDARGRVLTSRRVDLGDEPVGGATFEYDDDRQFRGCDEDTLATGEVDRRVEWTAELDGDGRLLSMLRSDHDFLDADDIYYTLRVFDYDGGELPTRYEDHPGQEPSSPTLVIDLSYDDRDRLVAARRGSELWYRYQWNDDDQLVVIESGNGGRRELSYDADGRLVRERKLNPGGVSIPEQLIDFAY